MMQLGNILGVMGIVVCLGSIGGRFIAASSYLFGFQAMNLYIIGMGFILMGCFAKLSGR